jgi:hypothetical protein
LTRRGEGTSGGLQPLQPSCQMCKILESWLAAVRTPYTSQIYTYRTPLLQANSFVCRRGGVSFARHRPRTCLLRKYTYVHNCLVLTWHLPTSDISSVTASALGHALFSPDKSLYGRLGVSLGQPPFLSQTAIDLESF